MQAVWVLWPDLTDEDKELVGLRGTSEVKSIAVKLTWSKITCLVIFCKTINKHTYLHTYTHDHMHTHKHARVNLGA